MNHSTSDTFDEAATRSRNGLADASIEFTVDPALFGNGANMIAVEVHRSSGETAGAEVDALMFDCQVLAFPAEIE